MEDARDLNKQKGVLLIEDYDKKARDWGWEADQGHDAKKVTRSRGNWLKAKKTLTAYVQDLERNNAVLIKSAENATIELTELRKEFKRVIEEKMAQINDLRSQLR